MNINDLLNTGMLITALIFKQISAMVFIGKPIEGEYIPDMDMFRRISGNAIAKMYILSPSDIVMAFVKHICLFFLTRVFF